MELELKHLAPYLPYELKAVIRLREDSSLPIDDDCIVKISCFEVAYLDSEYDEFKPILRPLSDIDEPIEDGYLGSDEFSDNEWVIYKTGKDITKVLQYDCIIELVKHHFDVFNLIGQNLAIDINTLKQ